MTLEEFKKKHADDPVLSKIEELKSTDLLKVLNASYIAKRFFGRSRSWFSQKINQATVNGKPAEFSDDELKTLQNALYTIALEIQDIADDLI